MNVMADRSVGRIDWPCVGEPDLYLDVRFQVVSQSYSGCSQLFSHLSQTPLRFSRACVTKGFEEIFSCSCKMIKFFPHLHFISIFFNCYEVHFRVVNPF